MQRFTGVIRLNIFRMAYFATVHSTLQAPYTVWD